MKLIILIGITSLCIATTAYAHEIENTATDNAQHMFIASENGGIACGMTTGEYKKALYKEPVPQKFTINASAYTAAADECGKSDGITASGNKVQENHTLACPRGYEFGTKIHIEGMGTYACEDRGGAIKGNKFDIYMETKEEAFAFGRRNLVAYIVS